MAKAGVQGKPLLRQELLKKKVALALPRDGAMQK